MIVDDSAVIRGMLTRWLQEEGDLTVCASAANGEMALSQMEKAKPDVVILDIEMPRMDGLTALPKLLEIDPRAKIVMSSTLTTRNAEVSIKAMSLGASDYLAKPEASRDPQITDAFRRELLAKVRALGGARRMRPRIAAPAVASSKRDTVVRSRPEGGLYGNSPIVVRKVQLEKPEVVAIGSSTGGPQALMTVFQNLQAPLDLPVLITQHMPGTFTKILAQHLDKLPGVQCAEAEDGEPLAAGRVYLAPGDYHMIVSRSAGGAVVRLNQDPPENFCRPAVDPLFRSLAQAFGKRVLAVVLTGMGHDGLSGGQAIVDAGGMVMAQDETSSVVWGMPGAVATGGLCSAVLPVGEIGQTIRRLAAGGGL
jgi:two-component system chemotaxis response regulator CheB